MPVLLLRCIARKDHYYHGDNILQDAINDFYTEVYTKLKENILDNVEIRFKGVDSDDRV